MPSNRRHDAKRDAAELPIVRALEQVGCIVYRKLPVDLLIRVPRDPPGILRALEIKSPTKTGRIRKRKDQPEQDATLAACGIPRVCTVEQALEVLSKVS